MAAHHHLPVRGAVIARCGRFRPDGGGIQQHLCPHQRHGAGAFGEPLIPADTDADPAISGVPDPKTGIAGAEVIFLLIPRPLRDMAFAVKPQYRAVGIGNRHRIEMRLPGLFEKADRQHHTKLARQCGKAGDQRVVFKRLCQIEMPGAFGDAEIGGGEQFLDQDDLRPLCRRLPDQRFGAVLIGGQIP